MSLGEEDFTVLAKLIAKMTEDEFARFLIASVVGRSSSITEAVGYLEQTKSNLIINMMDKKLFMADLKSQLDGDSFLDVFSGKPKPSGGKKL